MSNGLALSGVTAVLQFYLGNMYGDPDSPFSGNPVTVSCLAPDQVQRLLSGSNDTENQVNLFLHQVTHNAAWRNVDLPSLSADGGVRLSSPPLALDLHYLLTAYGSDFWQSEALLGYALLLLHENPVLLRADITKALDKIATQLAFRNNPLAPVLKHSGLADQIEMIKITPATLGREEMAWLWTALKADYRLTYPFQVSVVLIEPQQQTSLALPVLSHRVSATPMQPAVLLEVKPPHRQPAAASTDTVTVTGEFLGAITQVRLSNPRYGIEYAVPVVSATNAAITFVPDASKTRPAGIYELSAQTTDAAGRITMSTNTLPFALAPSLPAQAATVQTFVVTVTFSPNVLPGQSVSLALSTLAGAPTPFSVSAPPANPVSASSGTLGFQFPNTLPTGTSLLGRLQVDDVSSQVQVDWSVHPPVFTGPMVTV